MAAWCWGEHLPLGCWYSTVCNGDIMCPNPLENTKDTKTSCENRSSRERWCKKNMKKKRKTGQQRANLSYEKQGKKTEGKEWRIFYFVYKELTWFNHLFVGKNLLAYLENNFECVLCKYIWWIKSKVVGTRIWRPWYANFSTVCRGRVSLWFYWFQLEIRSAAIKSLGELDIFLAWIDKNHQKTSGAWYQEPV
jgi:hypothetical protein